MSSDPKALRVIMETASPPGLELGFRPMFGGITAYANGAPFASLSDVGLALKMTGADHAVDDLDATLEAVRAAGGVVTKPVFAFPGGRRFHFCDPAGNELAALEAD